MAQDVNAAFTAEETDSVRKIAHSLLISWKKESTLGALTFTVGSSLIGGNDIIGANPGAVGSPGIYKYFDESGYVTGLSWERGLNMPLGGLVLGLAEMEVENTTGRFSPGYIGGNSELFTSIQPRKPFIINAGFNINGVDQTIPQFSGIFDKQPAINVRQRTASFSGADYNDFFYNRFLDQQVMFTAQRTDLVIKNLFDSMGMSTAQYDLDPGINIIPFGIFPKDARYSDIINDVVQAENGHLYQDESGIFKFENRQHWDSAPYTNVQRVIHTSQVIDVGVPSVDHIVNVVEVKSNEIKKQPEQIIFRLNPFDNIELASNTTTEAFIEFEDPALSVTTPTADSTSSYYVANTQPDGSGTDITSSVSISSVYSFANNAKIIFSSSYSGIAYITTLVVTGRVAKTVGEIYTRAVDSSSVTAYEERKITIENKYIQNKVWAESFAQMIVEDFGELGNIQKITILAIPELQLGDLVSWQGRYWRIYDIKATLSPSVGFIQELTMLQRTIQSYFRIGISYIGHGDKIAP